MSLRRTSVALRETVEVERVADPSVRDMASLVAAAAQIQLDAPTVFRARVGDLEWQRESWRHYDICGEFRFAANRHAAAVSRCRIYVAEVDDLGRPGKEVTDPKIAVLGETIFGGPAAKAEGLRTAGIQLYVGGEGYIVAEGATNPRSDVWYMVTARSVRKEGSSYVVKRPQTVGGGKVVLKKGRDLLIRVWTPHPAEFDLADSPTRSVLPILREIEQLTKLTFSQIDSRLISAGLLLLPDGTDFPHQADKDGGVQGLMDMILEVAKAQLKGAGTAAGLVPILATIPADAGKAVQHVKFDTPLTSELKDKLDHAIRRLALGLDMNPEDLLGMGSANHWSGWQIEESSIKLFVEPALGRLCDALNVGYLQPALQSIHEDPEDFTLWYDTSPLTTRPNRFEDAFKLWSEGKLSDEALLMAGAFTSDDLPRPAEHQQWMAWKLLMANPQLVGDPTLARLAGLPEVGQQTVQTGGQPPPDQQQPELPAGGDQQNEQRALPSQPTNSETPAQQQGAMALLPAAEQVVIHALSLAGGRLLDRHSRGRFGSVAKFELHTQLKARDHDHAGQLLAGAFTSVPQLASHYGIGSGDLISLLSGYCVELLTRGYPHDPMLLAEVLRRGWQR
jgi:hypothetical protein